MKIGIIGAGSWGSALSIYFSNLNYPVLLWVREGDVFKSLIEEKENKLFLPKIKFPEKVNFTRDFKDFNGLDLIFLTVPVQFLRGTLKDFKKYLKMKRNFVNCSKGIEIKTLKIPSQIIKEELKDKAKKIATLSGPTFALELVKGYPTAAVFASRDENFSKLLQEKFSSNYFRFYRTKDIKGVEFLGALKNIYAIGSGIIKGLNLGQNTWASYLTRALHEIKRFCLFFNCKEKTISGLAGFGDLILTSSSEKSRNFMVGLKIARGEKLEDILKGMNMVAEGVFTLKAVYKISKERKISMPLVEVLYKILYKNLKLEEGINSLMLRELKEEDKI